MKNIKITNNENLPDVFVKAVENIVYKDYAGYRSDVFCSATTLLKPAYKFALERKLEKENIIIEVEAADYVWLFFGSAVHYIIEKASQNNENVFTEETMVIDVDGIRISGTPDYYDINKKTIYDIKTTSVWNVIYGSSLDDWEKQLNIYAYLFRQHNIEVTNINIIALIKDWSKSKSKTDASYPKFPVKNIKINNLWNEEKQRGFIIDRLIELKKAELDLNNYPTCSPEERWDKKTTYAVKKEGRKTALRVLDTKEDAEKYIVDNDCKKCHVETRPGESIRCADYCIVNKYCRYWNKINA